MLVFCHGCALKIALTRSTFQPKMHQTAFGGPDPLTGLRGLLLREKVEGGKKRGGARKEGKGGRGWERKEGKGREGKDESGRGPPFMDP